MSESETPTKPTKPTNIFDDPSTQAAIKRFFVENKGAAPPYRHAYFTKEYGIRAREIIDWVVEHKKSFKIALPDGYTIHALRQQWYEGTRYLRTRLDTPEGKYLQLLALIKCHTEFDYIEIRPRPALRGLLLQLSNTTQDQDTKWRTELTAWIDSDPPEQSKFERTDVVLADSDIAWAYEQFIGVDKLFYATFERNKILVIRYTHA